MSEVVRPFSLPTSPATPPPGSPTLSGLALAGGSPPSLPPTGTEVVGVSEASPPPLRGGPDPVPALSAHPPLAPFIF